MITANKTNAKKKNTTPEKNISLISSFAEDKIIDKKNNFIKKQKGGPAFYINQIFKKEAIRFDLLTASPFQVEILVKNNEEFGKITKKSKKIEVDYKNITTPILFISGILDEINLNNIHQYTGRIFLDAQSFVRNGSFFGGKKQWKPTKKIIDSFFCIKATQEELAHLSPELVRAQKNKCLLITKGKKGFDLYLKNDKLIYKPIKEIDNSENIGAGDSFFSYFVANFSRTENLLKAADYANKKIINFLENKV